ncbi:hypothetical protein AX16_009010 [Volvariella volvacea WC 439]|nr:hypothetical protein AX16_009010 [Volvariella volvacea WC 439]
MFANPIVASILSSSGAIPVKRNPNNLGSGETGSSDSASGSTIASGATGDLRHSRSAAQESLFKETSKALGRGEVIGVFPEGTSYTEPGIVQMLPGAAWAAVEYARWVWEGGKKGRASESGTGDVKDEGVDRDGRIDEVDLVIVPVAVVYTDKARYRSRITVTYGKPIRVRDYVGELWRALQQEEGSDDGRDAAAHGAVHEMMKVLERRIKGLTINATDWDTLHAAQTARDILWPDEKRLKLKDWVRVSQTLVNLFADLSLSSPSPYEPDTQHPTIPGFPFFVDHSSYELLKRTKAALIKYRALLHYTGLGHTVLHSLLPAPSMPVSLSHPHSTETHPPRAALPRTRRHKKNLPLHTLSKILKLPITIAQMAFSIPPFLFHVPAYVSGLCLERALAEEGEEEGIAQYRGIGAGLGLGVEIGALAGLIWKFGIRRLVDAVDSGVGRTLSGLSSSFNLASLHQDWGWQWVAVVSDWIRKVLENEGLLSLLRLPRMGLETLVRWTEPQVGGDRVSLFKRSFAIRGIIYLGVWAMTRWHNAMVAKSYFRFQQVIASYKLILALALRRVLGQRENIMLRQLEAYSKPPIPPVNPFIKRYKEKSKGHTSEPSGTSGKPESATSQESRDVVENKAPSRKLIRPLLEARVEASLYLTQLLRLPELEPLVRYLEAHGARI